MEHFCHSQSQIHVLTYVKYFLIKTTPPINANHVQLFLNLTVKIVARKLFVIHVTSLQFMYFLV